MKVFLKENVGEKWIFQKNVFNDAPSFNSTKYVKTYGHLNFD